MSDKTVEVSFDEQINTTVRDEVSKFVKNIRPTINGYLEKALLSFLGIENGCNRTEIDHCNSRASVLIDVLREQAKQDVVKLVNGLKLETLNTPAIKQALQKEYDSHFNYELKTIARDLAKRDALRIAESFSKKAIKKYCEKSGIKIDFTA